LLKSRGCLYLAEREAENLPASSLSFQALRGTQWRQKVWHGPAFSDSLDGTSRHWWDVIFWRGRLGQDGTLSFLEGGKYKCYLPGRIRNIFCRESRACRWVQQIIWQMSWAMTVWRWIGFWSFLLQIPSILHALFIGVYDERRIAARQQIRTVDRSLYPPGGTEENAVKLCGDGYNPC